eukprot:scaffold3038_cov250-Pinguiococcus_pyrenoidosus.AAC.5
MKVGIIALNCVGQLHGGADERQDEGDVPQAYSSEADEQEPNVQYDNETADKLRELRMQKDRAIRDEEYLAAKQIAEVEKVVHDIGMRIAKAQAKKAAAIRREDYDAAEQAKQEGGILLLCG